jgi:ribosome recycling factor
MTEEIEFILDSTKESMTGSIAHLEKNFEYSWKSIAQQCLEAFLLIITDQHTFSSIKISVPDARTITLQPFEKKTCCK